MTNPIVQAEDIGKQVTTQEGMLTILDGISLQVMPGDSLAVVGVSGSGKSTLLGLLAGLDVPTRGRVVLDGMVLNELDEDGRALARAGRVGFVFQTFQLLPALTAIENVMLPLELLGRKEAERNAREVLDRVGLGARLSHYPAQLSGGEQQRVAIARAFAVEPKILFADEPTGNLDAKTGHHIIDLLFEMNAEHHTTLVLVTHDNELGRRCANHVELDSGRIVPAPKLATANPGRAQG